MRICYLTLMVLCLGLVRADDGGMKIPDSGGCAWSTIENLDAFTNTDCLSFSPSSSIHFESTDCSCSVWFRLQGTNHGCSDDADQCDAHQSSTATISIPGLQGSSIPPGNFSLEYESDVGCGETVTFEITSSCECWASSLVAQQEYTIINGVLVVTATYYSVSTLSCVASGNNLQVKGSCNQDCSLDAVPGSIIVD